MLWDVFCRVVDNLGDIGVCWRLACGLAERGEGVRLWTDDASALTWLAPEGRAGVRVLAWEASVEAPGDVVIEAFGCDPPPAFVARLAATRPVWINLEYLSAEAYVERSHRLPSPQPGGLTKWFFYPGFNAATGGLLREPGLLERRDAFERDAWLAARGWKRRGGERVVGLFCYANSALVHLVETLATEPTLLLATAGPATSQLEALLGPGLRHGALRGLALPLLPQLDFDALLWAADLNFVRGEDSLVRALWAARPCVWQAYPQGDGAHAAKLEAMLACQGAGPAVAALWRAWNSLAPWPAAWPHAGPWQAQARRWCETQAALPDLVTQLQGFVAGKR